MTQMTHNEIFKIIVDAAVNIQRRFGPGLLESVYLVVLAHELRKRGLHVEKEVPIPLVRDNIRFEVGFRADLEIGFRADLIVENIVIVELKSIETVVPVHLKTLLTYLRLADKRLGLLLNFGEEVLKDGIHRVANGLEDESHAEAQTRKEEI
jgi:GxxExxY protein